MIKKLTITALVAFPILTSAEGSRISATTLLNDSYNTNTVTTSSNGSHSLATTGSIVLQQAEVNQSNIVNLTDNRNTVTIASGDQKLAATGSIIVRNKQLDGVEIINATQNWNTTVMTDETSDSALIGSINLFE